MLHLTDSTGVRSATQPRGNVSRTQTGSVSIPKNGNAASDRVNLTQRAQGATPPNPYNGVAPSSTKVEVGTWGTGQNDSLVSILTAQNYSRSEIYSKDKNGVSLLERVAQVNKLRDPNLIRSGQSLVIPSKERPATTPAPTAKAQSSEAPQDKGVKEVKVGKWGRDKSGSLFGILSEQGFSRKEILGDGGQNSLLNRVARANDLESPDRIREGQTLKVPGSAQALDQIDPPQTEQREPVKKLETLKPRPVKLPEPKAVEVKPVPVENKTEEKSDPERATANMGLLLDGVKAGKFKKDEFQYLNALSNRYEETRAQFSKDGYSNEELKSLGKFETNYGVTYTRLYNSDDVKLTNMTGSTSGKGQLRLRHYQEGGELWEGYKNGTLDTEQAINQMVKQRAEARAQGVQ